LATVPTVKENQPRRLPVQPNFSSYPIALKLSSPARYSARSASKMSITLTAAENPASLLMATSSPAHSKLDC
jgi:hypothetical protein